MNRFFYYNFLAGCVLLSTSFAFAQATFQPPETPLEIRGGETGRVSQREIADMKEGLRNE